MSTNTLVDSPELRAKRLKAYRANKYRFSPPPVCHANWDEEAWMNWIQFDDPKITGFLPYTSEVEATVCGSLPQRNKYSYAFVFVS